MTIHAPRRDVEVFVSGVGQIMKKKKETEREPGNLNINCLFRCLCLYECNIRERIHVRVYEGHISSVMTLVLELKNQARVGFIRGFFSDGIVIRSMRVGKFENVN